MGMMGGGPPGGMRGGPGGPGMYGGEKPSLRKAFSVFGNATYRNLWIASLGSFTGMQMQQVARALLAWELTGSFAVTGLLMLSFGLPMLAFSLIGGAVADRVNKRDLQIAQQIATGLLALLTAIMIATGTISVEALFIIGLAQGTFFAFGMPARTPLMAQVVGPDQLMSAIALQTAAMNVTRLIGPAVAGIVIAVFDISAAYFVQTAMYLLTIPFLLRVPRYLGVSLSNDEGSFGFQRSGGVIEDIKNGIGYVWHDAAIRRLMILGFITTMFGMPYMILLAGFVTQDLGQGTTAFGFLQSVTGVGALAGSLLIATMTEYRRKPMLQMFTGLLAGVGLVLLGVASMAFGFAGAIAAIVVLGFAFSVFQTLNNTMIMTLAIPEYQGRVMSIYMLTFSGFSLMALPLGLGADRIGAANIFMILGGVIVGLFVLAALVNPRYTFGRLDDRPKWADDPAYAGGGAMGMGGHRGPIPAMATAAIGNAAASVLATAVAIARPARRGARRDYMYAEASRPSRSYMGEAPATTPDASYPVPQNGSGARPTRRSGSRDYGMGTPAGGDAAYGLAGGADRNGANGVGANGRNGNRVSTNGHGGRDYGLGGDASGGEASNGVHAYGLEAPAARDPEAPLMIEAPTPAPPEPAPRQRPEDRPEAARPAAGAGAAWRPLPPPISTNGSAANGGAPNGGQSNGATAEEPAPVERVSVPPRDASEQSGGGPLSMAVVAGITATAVSAAAAMLLGRSDKT